MMRSPILLATAMVALLLAVPAATVAEDEPAGETEIEGVTWLLREQASEDGLQAIEEDIMVSLVMEADMAAGTGGCNRYSTSYVLDDERISFGEIASTLMACPDPAGTVEHQYYANLGLVVTWAAVPGRLTLAAADGAPLLIYEAAPEATVVGEWVAAGINNGRGGVVSSGSTSAVTATFTAEGDLSGNDGCNEYFTTYELDGEAIVIATPVGMSRAACPGDELAEQSSWYLAALEAATTWAVTDTGVLELRDGDGSLQVSYLPADG
jgi:putative lipoprotein